MKNKPLRHKETNTFKFQSFSERIGLLKVDVFHHVQAFDTDAEDGETHLQNAVDKWNVQNGTEAFEQCLRQLPDCKSLAQILLNRDKIYQTLADHINKRDSNSLQGLLELLVAFARDARHEFYPHFSDSLGLIFGIITTSRDTDVLEWSFQSLAYLLKFLWRSLLKEPASLVFGHVLPLLEDSRPVYIQEFAAQCFAFVARKVRDKDGLVRAILKKLDEEEDGVDGSGILLSETLFGSGGSFHSSAGQLLTLLYSFFTKTDVNTEVLLKVLSGAVRRLVYKVNCDNFGPFWEVASATLDKFAAEKQYQALTRMVQIVQVVCENKRGLYMQPAPIVTVLKTLVASDGVPEETYQALSDLVAKMLMAPSLKLSQEHTATLTSMVLKIDSHNIFLNFIGQVINCGSFEAHILPSLVQFGKSSRKETFLPILKLLAKVVEIKAPVCHSGLELQSWKQYPLGVQKSPFTEFVLEQLGADNLNTLVPALVVLPHLYCIDRKLSKDKLLGIISRSRENVFTLGLAVESAVHLLLTDELDGNLLMEVATKNKEKLAALRMFDIYLTAINTRDENLLKKLLDAEYHHELSSPYHKNRVLASHTLSLLEPEEGKIFSMCLLAENTPATITDYRDRIKNLQLMEFQYLQGYDDHTTEVALRFLLGNFYVNFKLMWDPLTSLVVSHAHSMESHKFWSIFSKQLTLACSRSKESKDEKKIVNNYDEFVVEFIDNMESQLDTPDHANFRSLLWKAMTYFADVCEARNRDISDLFLDFLHNEFFNNEASDLNFWNVIKDKNEEPEVTVGDEPMEVDTHAEPEEEDEEEEEDEGKNLKRAVKSKARPTMKILQAHMELLAKLRNPRGMFREPELNEAYHELLKMRNSRVQKLALDCVMAYKQPELMPYKEQLYGLVDDKLFKQQLVAFNVGTESDIVMQEHRLQLVPVVMRIVLSKMQSKSKIKGGSRRTLILRFLAGCRQAELLVFIKLAFKNVLGQCKDGEDLREMVTRVIDEVDLHRVVPPKRLSSAVQLANVVLAQLGQSEGGMAECAQILLRVQLVVAAQVSGLMRRKHEVSRSAIVAFRTTRKLSIDGIAKVFSRDYHGDASTCYNWTPSELDAVFDAVVWPSIEVLHIECVAVPTALLKLFGIWAGNTRYFQLLVKHKEGNKAIHPLAALIRLLNANVKGQVVSAVLDMLVFLLTLSPDQEENDEEVDDELENVTNVLPIDQEYEKKIQSPGLILNYGSRLLFPHISDLLKYLHRKVALASSKLKAKGGLGERDLIILSRVSELVSDPQMSLSLLRLVLPLAVKKANLGSGDKTLEPLLSTISFLLRRIQDPKQFCLQVAPLFGSTLGRQSRDRLCQIVFSRVINLISENEAKIICDLNAWDGRHVDEPDFEKRLTAFSSIKNMDDASMEFFVMLVHTAFHTLKAQKDLALRDCASLCLRTVSPKMAKRFADDPEKRSFVLERTIMEILRKGVRDKNESVQEEILGLLGQMVRECGELHPTLKDLQILACPDDMEVDFFENIRHMQVHRRSRALLRFCTVIEESGLVMRRTTLTQIIVPLATSYLCVEKFAKSNSLIDSAISALSTACNMLPWPEYEAILRFHLGRLPKMLDYQKQLVRTVIAVLNAFHFDMSSLEKKFTGPENKAPPEVVEQEMEADDEQQAEIKDVTEKIGTDGEKEAENGEAPEEEEEDMAEILEQVEEKHKQIHKSAAESAAAKAADTVREALRIKNTILRQLVPKLQTAISAKSPYDHVHKVNRNTDFAVEREQEAREVLRVPIALAIVKLLQKLPGDALKQNLTGVLLKVCVFLRSKIESTRRAARETMLEVLLVLGTKYLHKILTELCSLLTRGYQMHVLIFTVHALIVGVANIIQPEDIDPCLTNILQVCMADMFGDAAEEKEVAQIAGKTKEARSHKSFDTMRLVAKYVSEKSICDILIPLKDVLASSHSYKLVKKSDSCLQQIVQGLSENNFISPESLVTFAFGTASESIPALQCITKANNKQKKKLTDAQRAIQRPDTFLVMPAPKRSGPITTKTIDTHAHLFVAVGLQLLHFLLKKERIKEIPDHMLDPFVPILAESLESQHVRLTVLSLQCLSWLLKEELPKLKEGLPAIAENIFKILHKYSGNSQSQGSNFDMSNSAFKAIGVLVREVEYHNISKEQLRLLLLYAERDIQADSSRQATAFTLLKAILKRRMNSPELQQVIKTIAELSVTSPMNHVRQQARQVFLFYMAEYQSGKHYEANLTFLLSQLNFDLQTGRLSALDTLGALINAMPMDRLSVLSGLIFIPTAAVLVNDDDPLCRQVAAKTLRILLTRLDHAGKERLFAITVAWLKDGKLAHKRLGAQVCGLFVDREGASFASRLRDLLPSIYSCLCPRKKAGRFVRLRQLDVDADEDSEEVADGGTIQDHLLFQTLLLLVKISQTCPNWMHDSALEGKVSDICFEILPLATHPHEWVRLATALFIGCIFAVVDAKRLGEVIATKADEAPGMLVFKVNPELALKTLVLDYCDMLQPGEIKKALVEQIVKNLVYLARVIRHIPSDYPVTIDEEEGDEEVEEGADKKKRQPRLSLVWIARRMRKIVNLEVARAPKSGTLRTAVLQWTTAVIVDMGAEEFTKNPLLVHHMLAPVVREINQDNENNPHAPVGLRRFAKEVSNMIKEQIGVEAFAVASSKLTAKFSEHKATRKRKIAQQVMTEPEVYAKRKIKKQQAKKVAKKNRVNSIKGRVRKNHRVDRNVDTDF